jgi:tetratricopeptide (TPR) repeat protein
LTNITIPISLFSFEKEEGALMKTVIRMSISILAILFLFSCASGPDANKTVPQAEYEQAQKLRARIVALKFAQYAPDDFNTGETDFKAGEANYKKDNAAAKASFDSAIVSYRKVIRKGVQLRSKQSEDDIQIWVRKSDEIKASVAAGAEYKDAAETYKKAQALAAEDNWEEAEPLFQEAKAKYQKVFDITFEKKNKAQTKYDDTNKSLEGIKAAQDELETGNQNP